MRRIHRAPADVVIGLANGVVTAGNPWPFLTPESEIAGDLVSGDAAAVADLTKFFLSNLTDFPQVFGGPAGTIWRFSTATEVGTIGPGVIATPEPASAGYTALALGSSWSSCASAVCAMQAPIRLNTLDETSPRIIL